MTPAAPFRSYVHAPQFAPRQVRRVIPNRRKLTGLGDAQQAQLTQQIGSITGSAATGALSALALLHVVSLGAGVIPLIGVGIAAITATISAILNSGCGQSCIVTSNWANQAEDALQKNIAAYFALPAPRSQSAQAVALANFDNVWNYLVQECSKVAGGAGVNCIADRKAGACHWQQTVNSPYPGEPAIGQCWNWFLGYRDPIANDANVVPDSVAADASAAGTGSTASTSATFDWGTVALWGGAALVLMGVIGSVS